MTAAAATRTYLDYNATAPLRSESRDAMSAAFEIAGNPSSVHAEGRRARAVVERAREQVAKLVGARPGEVVFTSGATEANGWAMAGGWDTIYVAGVEHDSVQAPARGSSAELVALPLDDAGRLDLPAFEALLAARKSDNRVGKRALLTLQAANNETGILQPVREAVAIAASFGLTVHTDAVQVAGRMPVDIQAMGAALLSVTAHKLGGPKGVGALVIRDGTPLAPLMTGGGQERRRRAGTENVSGIAGFGAAAEAAAGEFAEHAALAGLRDRLETEIARLTPEAWIVGADAPRLANTTCVVWPGQAAETLVIKLDLAGVAVSAGAACSSGKVGASSVLLAMGLSTEAARSAIRVSFGWRSSDRDLESFLSAWRGIAASSAPRRAVA